MGPARVSGGGHHSLAHGVGTQAAKRRSNPTLQSFPSSNSNAAAAMLRRCDAIHNSKFIIHNFARLSTKTRSSTS